MEYVALDGFGYPTILELAGVTDAEFRGLGVSMLDTVSSSLSEREEAQKVSDLILCGNYFGKQ